MEEAAGIKEAFDMIDTDKKGKINLGELRVGLQKLGHHIPDADLQILMDAVSTHNTQLYCCPPKRESRLTNLQWHISRSLYAFMIPFSFCRLMSMEMEV